MRSQIFSFYDTWLNEKHLWDAHYMSSGKTCMQFTKLLQLVHLHRNLTVMRPNPIRTLKTPDFIPWSISRDLLSNFISQSRGFRLASSNHELVNQMWSHLRPINGASVHIPLIASSHDPILFWTQLKSVEKEPIKQRIWGLSSKQKWIAFLLVLHEICLNGDEFYSGIFYLVFTNCVICIRELSWSHVLIKTAIGSFRAEIHEVPSPPITGRLKTSCHMADCQGQLRTCIHNYPLFVRSIPMKNYRLNWTYSKLSGWTV